MYLINESVIKGLVLLAGAAVVVKVLQVVDWQGPRTKVLDASGKLLLSGFNDAHVHFIGGGMDLMVLN